MSDIPESHVQSNNRHHQCLRDVGQRHSDPGRCFDLNQIVTRAIALYYYFWGLWGEIVKESYGRLRDIIDTQTFQRKGSIIFSLKAALWSIKSMKTKCDFWVPITCRGTSRKGQGHSVSQYFFFVFKRKLNRTMVCRSYN